MDELNQLEKQVLLENEVHLTDTLNPALLKKISLPQSDIEELINKYTIFQGQRPNEVGRDLDETLIEIGEKMEYLKGREIPILLFLHLIEGLKFELALWEWSGIRNISGSFNIIDYFYYPSPFLVVPSAKQVVAGSSNKSFQYSAEIYYQDLFTQSHGLYIHSVKVNGKAIPYDQLNPQNYIVIPAVMKDQNKEAETQSLNVTIEAINSQGFDTTFYLEEKYEVIKACQDR